VNGFGSGGGTHLLVLLLVAIFILGLAYVILKKNPKIFDSLFGKPGFVGATATHVDGPNIYVVEATLPDDSNQNKAGSGGGTEGCSNTNAGDSYRDNQGFDCNECNREATWILTPSDSGDWSVKLGSHGNGIPVHYCTSYATVKTI
jgi:hypothetical protein